MMTASLGAIVADDLGFSLFTFCVYQQIIASAKIFKATK
jgi:hypothetical protein